MYYNIAIIYAGLIVLWGIVLLTGRRFMVLPIITDFLNEEGISFEKEKKALVLNDYDNRRITYTQSLNSVEIDFVDIKDFALYKDLKRKLRDQIKEDSTRLFPWSGVFYVTLGVIFAMLLQYLQSRL